MDLKNTILDLVLEGSNAITYGKDMEGIKLDNSSLFISGEEGRLTITSNVVPPGPAISGVESTVAITGGTIGLSGQRIQMVRGTLIIGPDAEVQGNVPESAYDAGFVFKDGEASVKGNPELPVELPVDLTIPEGNTLNVPADNSLIVPENVKLTVDGELTVEGSLTVDGSLEGAGAIRVETGGSITGAENISGKVQHKLTEDMVNIEKNSYTYTGKAITPKVTINEYTQDTDYKVTYTNNTNAGEATITITPTEEGKLYGEVTKSFTIAKVNPEYIVPTNLTATYGQTLADVTLPDGWTWDDETLQVGETGERTFKATFTPEDTDNYNIVEHIDVTITVGKATPTYTVPTGLAATYGQTLADVVLPKADNGTWSWQDAETQSVGEVGEHQFTAIFTPDDLDNYNTVEEEVTITVEKAELSDSQIKIEGDEPSFELGDEGAILTVTITGIEDENEYDNWTWSSNNTDVVTVNMLTPQEEKTRSTEDLVSTAQVIPKGIGDATITVTYEGANYKRTLSYDVSVKAKEEEPAPDPKPDPQPQPDPTPLYYNIQFENICEGVDASLSKGVVKEGNQVSVYVEVEEGYDSENLKVLFKRSLYGYWEEVEEGVQPGEYIIYNVYTDIYVKVEGVEKIEIEEEPTGMSNIESTKVYAQNGNLYVYTSQPQEVMIITMNGTILKRERQEGLRSYSLPKGVYIICIGEERMKVRN